ncbi:MAG: hypothetical protein ACTTJZ_07840 [Sphaerochaetaceae bacterium]
MVKGIMRRYGMSHASVSLIINGDTIRGGSGQSNMVVKEGNLVPAVYQY